MDALSNLRPLYGAGTLTVEELERLLAPAKAMVSESGWVYLINDANDFLRVQSGHLAWNDEERQRAAATIKARVEVLAAREIIYRKIIIPEKSVVYADYLPRVIRGLAAGGPRPAEMMRADHPEAVSYLAEYLQDARSYGHVYFRGDTHTNWLGAWFVHRFIVQALRTAGLDDPAELPGMADMTPSLASYDGDVYTQLAPALRATFNESWGFTTARYGFEQTIRLELPAELRHAAAVEVPADYRERFKSRESFVYERADGRGPRAVIFRDSTLDLCLDWLAQHFSRAVFIWHEGQVYQDVIERERPDVVLHVMAERFVTRYNMFPPFAMV